MPGISSKLSNRKKISPVSRSRSKCSSKKARLERGQDDGVDQGAPGHQDGNEPRKDQHGVADRSVALPLGRSGGLHAEDQHQDADGHHGRLRNPTIDERHADQHAGQRQQREQQQQGVGTGQG
jgi:hypothetical protein